MSEYSYLLKPRYEIGGRKVSYLEMTKLASDPRFGVAGVNAIMRATREVEMEDAIEAETDPKKKRIMKKVYENYGIANPNLF